MHTYLNMDQTIYSIEAGMEYKYKPLEIKGTAKTPKIVYSPDDNRLEIQGKSIPENHAAFYSPVFEWLEEFSENPPEFTKVDVYLEYFNTSSSKVLLKIFKTLEDILQKNKNIEVNWYYEEDDLDMKECGQDYGSMLNIPFTMIEVEGE